MTPVQAPEYREPVLNGQLLAQAWYLFLQALTTRVNANDPVSIALSSAPTAQPGIALIYADELTGALLAAIDGGPFLPLALPKQPADTLMPAGGKAAVDLAKGPVKRLVLDGSAVTLNTPFFTRSDIAAGMRLTVLVDQSGGGGFAGPSFQAGAYGSDANSQTVASTGRSGYFFLYDGTIWILEHFRAGISTT